MDLDRSILLKDKVWNGKDKSNAMPMFITTFSPQYPEIKRIVKRHLPVLHGDESLHKILSDGWKFVTRHAPTLGNLFPPSVVQSKRKKKTWLNIEGTYKCGASKCVTCERILVSAEFVSNNTKKLLKMKKFH